MARNLSVFGSDTGLGRGVAANPFLMLHREMNRLFDDVFRSTPVPFDQSGEAIVPQINVSQTEKELRVTAELPGVSEKDIDVRVDGDVLTIRAEKKVERKEEKEKENYYFVERAYGTFQRSLRLPFSVDAGQVQAQFENGVLTVTLPKPQGQQQSRKIEVQKAKESAQSGESANTQAGMQTAST
jgi:HSP20 family protein